ncbi:MAG: cytochrome b/b6 domain-containing protein [Candidatus Marinimicrobia bacterium]|nr:cytochrome b/b6 domain-containing protein [Candidatus Neomarinimicrobiota bacterium]
MCYLESRIIKIIFTLSIFIFTLAPILSQDSDPISSDDCLDCHEESKLGSDIAKDLSHSIHEGFECQDCHIDKLMMPHVIDPDFTIGCDGCRNCHEEQSDDYTAHGRESVIGCGDIPTCSSCHGDHDVLPSDMKSSRVHPTNLPIVCGNCHENLDLILKHELLLDHPVEMYTNSVHGKASKGGIYMAATCNDCHSTSGTAHKIFSPGHPLSSINHFNIPKTCGVCHKGVENDYWDGIHGKLVKRGETDAPVCTDCHGEHGIISPDDPRSPVSKSRVAQATCSPCHESTKLNEKYGLPTERLTTFVDSYHGLKSKAGDTHVANCASCHGVHRILPSTDSSSTIFPGNLQHTCGECHPGISVRLASAPIHGVSGNGLQTSLADIVENIYIVAIVIIIGLMILHWILDLLKQIRGIMAKPQIRRMRLNEVWQHAFLMISFITLVITGFSLRFSESWWVQFMFGHVGGFEIRGIAHRISAVIFILTVLWHTIYLITSKRGNQFFWDMLPKWKDFTEFFQRIKYYLSRRKGEHPIFGRFSYVEKAEYWALVWGTIVMIFTGLFLWFDNYFIQFIPKGFLDVTLVIHYWEAWLATLAIVVWHFYSTIFSPDVYPMNPSWLTGTMPEDMYTHEHPGYVDEAKQQMDEELKAEMKKLASLQHDQESDDENIN